MNRPSIPMLLFQNSIFCMAIALFLWLFVPTIGQYGFISCFVHSQAIGNSVAMLAISTSILAGRLSPTCASEKIYRVIGIVVATPLGIYLGIVIATWLLGIDNWISDRDQMMMTLAIAIVASVAFNWHINTHDKLLRLELSASEERRRAESAQHAMLRAQLDPHMLFNTLANLRALIETDRNQALSMLDQLDGFLRETLTISKAATAPLASEFKVLEQYLGLMKVRFGNRLNYELTLPDSCRELGVPTLLLQPLVENAIRHGLEPSLAGGNVKVTASPTDTHLTLSVIDNGVGIELPLAATAAVNTGCDGFGLHNLQQRLTARYGDYAQLNWQNTSADGSGTNATISLPMHQLQIKSNSAGSQ